MIKNINIEALKALIGTVVFMGSIVAYSTFIDSQYPDIKSNYSQVDHLNKDLGIKPDQYIIEDIEINEASSKTY